jgi:hypothetical protein
VESSKEFVVGLPVVIDIYDPNTLVQESKILIGIPSPTALTIESLKHAHGSNGPFPVIQPGEKGVLIAEWNEYTPTSGTDIKVTSDLTTIA